MAHLQRVSDYAARFAATFCAAEWGRVAGLWHDLGKYSCEFQAYLRSSNGMDAHLEVVPGRVDHSTAGAQLAIQKLGNVAGRLLAYPIAGHHSGLLDARSTGESSLERRLKKTICRYDAPAELLDLPRPSNPTLSHGHGVRRRFGFQLSLFCRMLFSCLVDADFLATEEVLSPGRTSARNRELPSLAALSDILDGYLAAKAEAAPPGVVNTARQEVLAACRAAAPLEPGVFSLTVPTGGGKTLSALSFALRHAAAHAKKNFRRVIMAIPYTSIIEQTAAVYRDALAVLGPEAVLEHHSSMDVDDPRLERPWSRFGCENWDAPLVVTTNVQFFESLFSHRTSKSRKIHNIARSIVILDEAQSLPVGHLEPCLAVLRELATDYGCTIVLCTATQPAITRRDDFAIGLEGVREIVPDPAGLYERLRRVDTHRLGTIDDRDLAGRLSAHRQVLCVVNTRRQAAALFDSLRTLIGGGTAEGLFHLSTCMCANHRTAVLTEIRKRLKDDLPCRVVSTQLIEAGVDIDFPTVYRSLAGFDSLAQAAGRCNREGRLPRGDVFVFEAADSTPPPFIHKATGVALELMPYFDDPLSLEAIERYFEQLYWSAANEWRDGLVMRSLCDTECEFDFRTASESFRIVEDQGRPVIVPWDEAATERVRQLTRDTKPDWRIQRRLQRYVVAVRNADYSQLVANGDVAIYHEQYAVLVNQNCYDPQLGLGVDNSGVWRPDELLA